MIVSFFLKFIKFGVVGLSGLIIDFSITFLLKEKLKLQKYIANSFGFVTAATSNYALNRLWTFMSHNPKVLREYSCFLFISAIGLVFNNFFLWLFHNKFNLNFYLAKFFAIGITMFWNFFANYFMTFGGLLQ